MSASDAVKYTTVTVSANAVITGQGTLYGFIVANHSSGTIKVYDSLTQTGTVLIDTYTFTAGSTNISFPEGISFNTGISITAGGTLSITMLYLPNA